MDIELTLELDFKHLDIRVFSEAKTKTNAIYIMGEPRQGRTVFAEALRRAFRDLGAEVTVTDGGVERPPLGGRLPFEGSTVNIFTGPALDAVEISQT